MAKRRAPTPVKYLAFVVAALVIWKVFFASEDAPVQPTATAPQPQSVPPSGGQGNQDTTQETLNSLSEQLNILSSQYAADKTQSQSQIDNLTQQNQQLQDEITASQGNVDPQLQVQLESLQNKVNALADDVQNNPLITLTDVGSDVDLTEDTFVIGQDMTVANAARYQMDQDGYVIIEPETVRASMQIPDDARQGVFNGLGNIGGVLGGQGGVSNGSGQTVTQTSRGVLDTAGGIGDQLGGNENRGGAGRGNGGGVPMLTIPENTRFFNAKARSTILGRIPRGGTVQEPFEFQVELSGDNVTPGGFVVPGLAKMVMRGIATGDAALKCARGNILSLTIVYDDGTITQIGGAERSSSNRPLATILDAYATECVPGKEVGNELVYSGAQLGANAIQSVANAKAQAQLNSIDTGGGVTTNVEGSDTAFIGAELIAGLGEAGSDLLANRYANVFNAIMVPLDTSLIVEFKQQININYAKDGRKIVHPAYHQQQANDGGIFQ